VTNQRQLAATRSKRVAYSSRQAAGKQQANSRQTAGKQQISSSTQSAAGITSASARHSALSKRFDRWVDQHNRLDASLDIALNFTSLSLTNRQTRGKREANARQMQSRRGPPQQASQRKRNVVPRQHQDAANTLRNTDR
jgi:hypothetical protein